MKIKPRIKRLLGNLSVKFQYRFFPKKVGQCEGLVFRKFQVQGAEKKLWYRFRSKSDYHVLHMVFNSRTYALAGPHADALLKYYGVLVKAGTAPMIVDAGANIGASPVFFALNYKQSKIIAIEPERNNAAICRLNLEGISNATLLEAALSSENKDIYLEDPGLSDWGFRTSEQKSPESYNVKSVTLNQIFQSNPSAKPLLVKIDIEGFEKELFERNVEWVEHTPLIIIELHDKNFPGQHISQKLIKLIASMDFDLSVSGENFLFFNNKILREYY